MEVNDEVVDSMVKEVLYKIVKKIHNYAVGYPAYVQNHFKSFFDMQPRLDLEVKDFDWGVEITMRVYIDEPDIAKIRESIKRQLMDRKLRVEIYKSIKGERIRITSGELHALLSGLRSSPTEGGSETGGDRTEVRDQEGGYTSESSPQGNL
jgi:hypothetical protein